MRKKNHKIFGGFSNITELIKDLSNVRATVELFQQPDYAKNPNKIFFEKHVNLNAIKLGKYKKYLKDSKTRSEKSKEVCERIIVDKIV